MSLSQRGVNKIINEQFVTLFSHYNCFNFLVVTIYILKSLQIINLLFFVCTHLCEKLKRTIFKIQQAKKINLNLKD